MKKTRYLLLLLGLIIGQSAFAGLYNFSSRISTADSAVKIGSPFAEATVSSSLMGSSYTAKRFGYITFGVDQHSKTYFNAMDVEITIHIERWLGASYLGDSVAIMKLYYNPEATSEKDGQSIYLENMDSYHVTIQQIKINGTIQRGASQRCKNSDESGSGADFSY